MLLIAKLLHTEEPVIIVLWGEYNVNVALNKICNEWDFAQNYIENGKTISRGYIPLYTLVKYRFFRY